MTGYIVALDQGTTSSRAILYNDAAQMVAVAQKSTSLQTPKAGYVEQDAMQIWQTQLSCVHDVINQAGLLATDIKGIAITNQRETTVVWDRQTGQPLAPAIIWQDRRSTDWCEALKTQPLSGISSQTSNTLSKPSTTADTAADMQSLIQQITGLRIDPYFSASKLVWLLDNHPKIRERATQGRLAFGTVDSWLVYKLTGGEHLMDISNASRTLLYDIHQLAWSSTLLDLFEIPGSVLPEVLASNAEFGKTKKGLFAKQLPIYAVLGDQQAALFGQGCWSPGMAKNTYGTGCFMLMNIGDTPRLSQHQLLTTIAWQQDANAPLLPDSLSLSSWMRSGKRMLQPSKPKTSYALEGSVFMAGAIVQWLRDNLGLVSSSDDVESLARQVSDSEGVVMVPAFTGLGAPHWRPQATASIRGMTRGTTKAHIARAALESIALQTYDVLQAMQKDSPQPLTELRVDGGASRNDLLMQFQADLLGVPVLRPKDTEVTAKGVAMLAGLHSGLYDQSVLQNAWQLDKAFAPKMSADERQQYLQRWQQAVSSEL